MGFKTAVPAKVQPIFPPIRSDVAMNIGSQLKERSKLMQLSRDNSTPFYEIGYILIFPEKVAVFTQRHIIVN